MDDFFGLTVADATRKLKKQGLTPSFFGTGETVTSQIPAPGQKIPVGSQVLLYLGEEAVERICTVPDFLGMNRQQAAQTAGERGLYLQITGNREISPGVIVTAQDIPKDTQVPVGTTITLEFTDRKARD